MMRPGYGHQINNHALQQDAVVLVLIEHSVESIRTRSMAAADGCAFH